MQNNAFKALQRLVSDKCEAIRATSFQALLCLVANRPPLRPKASQLCLKSLEDPSQCLSAHQTAIRTLAYLRARAIQDLRFYQRMNRGKRREEISEGAREDRKKKKKGGPADPQGMVLFGDECDVLQEVQAFVALVKKGHPSPLLLTHATVLGQTLSFLPFPLLLSHLPSILDQHLIPLLIHTCTHKHQSASPLDPNQYLLHAHLVHCVLYWITRDLNEGSKEAVFQILGERILDDARLAVDSSLLIHAFTGPSIPCTSSESESTAQAIPPQAIPLYLTSLLHEVTHLAATLGTAVSSVAPALLQRCLVLLVDQATSSAPELSPTDPCLPRDHNTESPLALPLPSTARPLLRAISRMASLSDANAISPVVAGLARAMRCIAQKSLQRSEQRQATASPWRAQLVVLSCALAVVLTTTHVRANHTNGPQSNNGPSAMGGSESAGSTPFYQRSPLLQSFLRSHHALQAHSARASSTSRPCIASQCPQSTLDTVIETACHLVEQPVLPTLDAGWRILTALLIGLGERAAHVLTSVQLSRILESLRRNLVSHAGRLSSGGASPSLTAASSIPSSPTALLHFLKTRIAPVSLLGVLAQHRVLPPAEAPTYLTPLTTELASSLLALLQRPKKQTPSDLLPWTRIFEARCIRTLAQIFTAWPPAIWQGVLSRQMLDALTQIVLRSKHVTTLFPVLLPAPDLEAFLHPSLHPSASSSPSSLPLDGVAYPPGLPLSSVSLPRDFPCKPPQAGRRGGPGGRAEEVDERKATRPRMAPNPPHLIGGLPSPPLPPPFPYCFTPLDVDTSILSPSTPSLLPHSTWGLAPCLHPSAPCTTPSLLHPSDAKRSHHFAFLHPKTSSHWVTSSGSPSSGLFQLYGAHTGQYWPQITQVALSVPECPLLKVRRLDATVRLIGAVFPVLADSARTDWLRTLFTRVSQVQARPGPKTFALRANLVFLASYLLNLAALFRLRDTSLPSFPLQTSTAPASWGRLLTEVILTATAGPPTPSPAKGTPCLAPQGAGADPDTVLRATASCAAAHLPDIAAGRDAFAAGLIQAMMQSLTAPPDPRRASFPASLDGLTHALGALFASMGAMRTAAWTHPVAQALCHVAVQSHRGAHTQALKSLALLVNSAGPGVVPQAQRILETLAGLLNSVEHDHAMWMHGAGCVANAVISALGPDLPSHPGCEQRAAELFNYFSSSTDPLVQAECVSFLQNTMLLNPARFDLAAHLDSLLCFLHSACLPVRQTALSCLRQLVERALLASEGGVPRSPSALQHFPRLHRELLLALDSETSHFLSSEIRLTLQSLLAKTQGALFGDWTQLLVAVIESSFGSNEEEEAGRGGLLGDGEAGGEGEREEAARPKKQPTSVQEISGTAQAATASFEHHAFRAATKLFAFDALRSLLVQRHSASQTQRNAPALTASSSTDMDDFGTLERRFPDLVALCFGIASQGTMDALRCAAIHFFSAFLQALSNRVDPMDPDRLLIEQAEIQIATLARPVLSGTSVAPLPVVAAIVRLTVIALLSGALGNTDSAQRMAHMLFHADPMGGKPLPHTPALLPHLVSLLHSHALLSCAAFEVHEESTGSAPRHNGSIDLGQRRREMASMLRPLCEASAPTLLPLYHAFLSHLFLHSLASSLLPSSFPASPPLPTSPSSSPSSPCLPWLASLDVHRLFTSEQAALFFKGFTAMRAWPSIFRAALCAPSEVAKGFQEHTSLLASLLLSSARLAASLAQASVTPSTPPSVPLALEAWVTSGRYAERTVSPSSWLWGLPPLSTTPILDEPHGWFDALCPKQPECSVQFFALQCTLHFLRSQSHTFSPEGPSITSEGPLAPLLTASLHFLQRQYALLTSSPSALMCSASLFGEAAGLWVSTLRDSRVWSEEVVEGVLGLGQLMVEDSRSGSGSAECAAVGMSVLKCVFEACAMETTPHSIRSALVAFLPSLLRTAHSLTSDTLPALAPCLAALLPICDVQSPAYSEVLAQQVRGCVQQALDVYHGSFDEFDDSPTVVPLHILLSLFDLLLAPPRCRNIPSLHFLASLLSSAASPLYIPHALSILALLPSFSPCLLPSLYPACLLSLKTLASLPASQLSSSQAQYIESLLHFLSRELLHGESKTQWQGTALSVLFPILVQLAVNVDYEAVLRAYVGQVWDLLNAFAAQYAETFKALLASLPPSLAQLFPQAATTYQRTKHTLTHTSHPPPSSPHAANTSTQPRTASSVPSSASARSAATKKQPKRRSAQARRRLAAARAASEAVEEIELKMDFGA